MTALNSRCVRPIFSACTMNRPIGKSVGASSSTITGSSFSASRAMIASWRTLGEATLALVHKATTSRAPVSCSRIQLSQSWPAGVDWSQNTS